MTSPKMERNRRMAGKLLACLLGLMLTAVLVWGQAETGQITGTVMDQTGAVVPNAKVTVKGVATGSVRTATTNASGIYTVTNLQPAEYTVTVEATGFSTKSVSVNVAVGSRVGQDIQLQVGQTGTTIEVAETATTVNTETQTLGGIVNSQQIVELPSINRNPYALVGTVGNVSGNTPDGRGAGFAINGQRASSTNVLLDGVANNDEFAAVIGQAVPLDAVQEFSVLTNNFTAEFGRATGGIVNAVTKSGTNGFHGTAYEFNRLSHLASNDFNSNANGIPKAVFTRNQFGYSLGGPVKKNKLFFFSSTEWTRIRSTANNDAYIPTSNLLALADPKTQAFFSKYGALSSGITVLGLATKASLLGQGVDLCKGLAPTSKCASIGSGVPLFQRISFTVPADSGGGFPQNTYSTVNRVDYNMSEKTQMYFRYAYSNEKDFPGATSSSPYNGFNATNAQYNNSAVFSLTRSFSPTFISQTKVDFNRFNNQQPLAAYGPVPTLYMSPSGAPGLPGGTILFPGYNPYTPGSGVPFGGPQNFVQIYEDLSKIWGKHQIRFGGSYNYLRDNRTFGAYETAGDYLGTTIPKSMENFLQGQLYQVQVAVSPQGKYPCAATVTPACTLTLPVGPPNFSRSNRYHDYSLYIQDAYKISPRVTINLGLRWEVFGTQHNKNGNLDSNYYMGSGSTIQQQIANGNLQNAPSSPIGKLWDTNYGNFGPRIGIAWDLFGDGKTSLRGGYGRAFERNFGNVTFNVIQNPPNYATISVTNGVDLPSIPISTDNFGILSGSSGTKALPKVTLRAVDPNIKTAWAHLFSAALEHRFGEHMLGAVEYSGSLGRNQYGIANVNRVGYGNFYLGVPCTPGTDGDFGNCTARLNNFQYGSINFRENGGTSNYNAMNLRWDVHSKWGLNLRANYTWSHAIDDLSDTFSSGGVANLGWLDPFHPALDRGDAYYDIRHRLVFSGIWDIGMKGAKGWQKQVLKGWQLAPILSMVSGSPFSIYDCTNGYNACPFGFATKPVPIGGDGLKATATPNTYNYLNMANYFDSSYFDPKTGLSDVGRFPSNMVGRNRFRGPGAWNVDLGIYKSFFLGERYNLQFRAEGYNFFNHPNLNNPSSQDFSGGDFVQTSFSGRRFFQMAMKFIF
jgi:hypothetical protein